MNREHSHCALLEDADLQEAELAETYASMHANQRKRCFLLPPSLSLSAVYQSFTGKDLHGVRVAVDISFPAPVHVGKEQTPCQTLHDVFDVLPWLGEGFALQTSVETLLLEDANLEAETVQQTWRDFTQQMQFLRLPLTLWPQSLAHRLTKQRRLQAQKEQLVEIVETERARLASYKETLQTSAGLQVLERKMRSLEEVLACARGEKQKPYRVVVSGTDREKATRFAELLRIDNALAVTCAFASDDEPLPPADFLFYICTAHDEDKVAEALMTYTGMPICVVQVVDEEMADFTSLIALWQKLQQHACLHVLVYRLALNLAATTEKLFAHHAVEADTALSGDKLESWAQNDAEAQMAYKAGKEGEKLAAAYGVPLQVQSLRLYEGLTLLQQMLETRAQMHSLETNFALNSTAQDGIAPLIQAQAENAQRVQNSLEAMASCQQRIAAICARVEAAQNLDFVKARLFDSQDTGTDMAADLCARVYQNFSCDDVQAVDISLETLTEQAMTIWQAYLKSPQNIWVETYTTRLAKAMEASRAELRALVQTLQTTWQLDEAKLLLPQVKLPVATTDEETDEDMQSLWTCLEDAQAQQAFLVTWKDGNEELVTIPVLCDVQVRNALQQWFAESLRTSAEHMRQDALSICEAHAQCGREFLLKLQDAWRQLACAWAMKREADEQTGACLAKDFAFWQRNIQEPNAYQTFLHEILTAEG